MSAALAGLMTVGCAGDEGNLGQPGGTADAAPIAIPDAAPDLDRSDCATELPCPLQTAGRVSVCGRVIDIASGEVIAAASATGQVCEGTSDRCVLSVRAFDALALAADPTVPPLLAERVEVDDCGRYRLLAVTRPFNGYVAVHVDDRGTGNAYAPAIRMLPVAADEVASGVAAHALSRATDAQWTATAGDPFEGSTFSEVGAALVSFRASSGPVEGVTASGTAYYFDDPPGKLTTVAPGQSATGPNGAALMTNRPPLHPPGTGGTPEGCEWYAGGVASIPGIILAAEAAPVVAGGAPNEPCPE